MKIFGDLNSIDRKKMAIIYENILDEIQKMQKSERLTALHSISSSLQMHILMGFKSKDERLKGKDIIISTLNKIFDEYEKEQEG